MTITEEKKRNLAQRVFDLTDPYIRDGETVESTMELMETEPHYIIEFLLDLIDDLNAQKTED